MSSRRVRGSELAGKPLRFFTDRLVETGIDPSVGSVGDAYDNALAESQIGLFKSELIPPHGPWRDRDHLEAAVLDRVAWFNTERPHESIDDHTPVQVERSSLPLPSQPRRGRRHQTKRPQTSGGSQAQRTLATLGALGATPEEATREAAVALCHATLSIAAAVIALAGNGGPGQHAAAG